MTLVTTSHNARGIEIYRAPTADSRDSWIASVQHIAVEGRCFVLSCNQFNRRRDFPSDYDSVYGTDPEAVAIHRRLKLPAAPFQQRGNDRGYYCDLVGRQVPLLSFILP